MTDDPKTPVDPGSMENASASDRPKRGATRQPDEPGETAKPARQSRRGRAVEAASGAGSSRPGPPGREEPHLPQPLRVSLERSDLPESTESFLWWAVRDRQEAVSFPRYQRFMNSVLCGRASTEFGGAPVGKLLEDIGEGHDPWDAVRGARRLLSSGEQYVDRVRGYQILKEATELWLMVEAGLALGQHARTSTMAEVAREFSELGPQDPLRLGDYARSEFSERARDRYLQQLGDGYQGLPYIGLILNQLGALPLKADELVYSSSCYGIQFEEVSRPIMLELIWSYWMEQGMLVQSMAALSMRFQNKRVSEHDPLADIEIDPLRGVANLLWGYVQDEPNRLTVQRRAYEYVHEYGLELTGAAVPRLRPADRRTEFLRAFHDLLSQTYEFYQADDDTTVVADPFRVLNSLQTVNLVLAEAATNQWGSMTWTSRVEMLIQQWILSRPELREFLPGRNMVPYQEPWMERVDAMRQRQGWGGASIKYFRDLATYGEMLLLTIRWGDWSVVIDPNVAANWARAWRPIVYSYINAYRMVTGVDLTNGSVGTYPADDRYAQPAYLLERMIRPEVPRTRARQLAAAALPRRA